MNAIIEAFYMTIELWVFVGILGVSLVVEELIKEYKAKAIDNPTLR